MRLTRSISLLLSANCAMATTVIVAPRTSALPVQEAPAQAVASADNVQSISRAILLKSIELNRYMLRYRLENDRQPKTRLLRYFLAQEAGASSTLAFEILADKELGRNQNTPLRVNQTTMRRAFNTAMTGSVIGGGSSALELTSNVFREVQNRRKGLDATSAENTFVKYVADLDALLAQRDRIAAGAPESVKVVLEPESRILKQLRNYYVLEFLGFHQDLAGYRNYENTYFFLNACTNTIAAISAHYGKESLKTPRLAGPSNVLFTVAGALLMVSPPLSTAVSHYAKQHARKSLLAKLGLKAPPVVDVAVLEQDLKTLRRASETADTATLNATGSVSQRLALYSEASGKFDSMIHYEDKRAHLLKQVAVQTNFFGPPIGATLLTQGILGSTAYFDYQRKPITLRKLKTADRVNYAGSIVGTVGAGTAVVGTAGLLAASLIYRHRLSKENRLPSQILQQRLDALATIEREVRLMPTVQ